MKGISVKLILCLSIFTALLLVNIGVIPVLAGNTQKAIEDNPEMKSEQCISVENSEVVKSECSITNEVELDIPSVEWIKMNGYPVNESGETYGPDVSDSVLDEPDLILAENSFGQVGYIRATDLDSGVQTIEDAINYTPREYAVNMYLSDGCTVIGEFMIVIGGYDAQY